MSFDSLMINTVVVEKRTAAPHPDTNEEVETFDDEATIRASVQDRAPTELRLPDIDGPVIINAVIFTRYADGLGIAHLDRLRQTDVDPPRLYRVIFPSDPAGRHHHWEMRCERVLGVAVEAGS